MIRKNQSQRSFVSFSFNFRVLSLYFHAVFTLIFVKSYLTAFAFCINGNLHNGFTFLLLA